MNQLPPNICISVLFSGQGGCLSYSKARLCLFLSYFFIASCLKQTLLKHELSAMPWSEIPSWALWFLTSNLSWIPFSASQNLERHILNLLCQMEFIFSLSFSSLSSSSCWKRLVFITRFSDLGPMVDLISSPESPSRHLNWLCWPFVLFEKPNNSEAFRQIYIFILQNDF